MNTIEHTSSAIVTLENSEMIREWATKFSNMIVEASDLAQEVHGLRDSIQLLRDQLAVANEAAARAIEERNAAYHARDKAVESKEIAEQAWQQVNTQRIEAERELQSTREELSRQKAEIFDLNRQLENAKLDVELWTSEANEFKRLHAEAVEDKSRAVDLVRAEAVTIAEALRMEIQALKEERYRISDELEVSERDCQTLRKMISEAKLASEGLLGVLQGTIAVE
jgi:chromosome segregation ATPase